jgi:hypothetical protein
MFFVSMSKMRRRTMTDQNWLEAIDLHLNHNWGYRRLAKRYGFSRQALRMGIIQRTGTSRSGTVDIEKIIQRRAVTGKAWYERNKERQKILHKIHYEKNKEEKAAYAKMWHEKNKERCRAVRKIWYEANKAKITAQSVAHCKARKKTDHLLRIKEALRARLHDALKRPKVSKSVATFELVGCNTKQLKEHLESNFHSGMNWENYGMHWVIDHRRPCASFNLADIKEQRLCFHWSNLQPMITIENRQKGASWNGFRHTHTGLRLYEDQLEDLDWLIVHKYHNNRTKADLCRDALDWYIEREKTAAKT